MTTDSTDKSKKPQATPKKKKKKIMGGYLHLQSLSKQAAKQEDKK